MKKKSCVYWKIYHVDSRVQALQTKIRLNHNFPASGQLVNLLILDLEKLRLRKAKKPTVVDTVMHLPDPIWQ